jgi:pSer/pThr/pTyr-binding forkhead associated (FHA) protein
LAVRSRSSLLAHKEEEEEEEEESQTLRLRGGTAVKEAEREAVEEDEDTDSEDTLGLLQQSQALITRDRVEPIITDFSPGTA